MSEDNLEHSSFAVAVIPEFDENGKWNGVVTSHLEETVMDDLTEEELLQIRTVNGMLATCLILMEQDQEFLEYVQEQFYVQTQEIMAQFVDAVDTTPNFTKEGNVIKLDFSTKTHGNA